MASAVFFEGLAYHLSLHQSLVIRCHTSLVRDLMMQSGHTTYTTISKGHCASWLERLWTLEQQRSLGISKHMDTRLSCQGTISLPVANILKLQRQQANRTGRENEGSRQCRPRCHGRKIRGKPLPLSSFLSSDGICKTNKHVQNRKHLLAHAGFWHKNHSAFNLCSAIIKPSKVSRVATVDGQNPAPVGKTLQWMGYSPDHSNTYSQIGSSPQLVQLMAYKIENG